MDRNMKLPGNALLDPGKLPKGTIYQSHYDESRFKKALLQQQRTRPPPIASTDSVGQETWWNETTVGFLARQQRVLADGRLLCIGIGQTCITTAMIGLPANIEHDLAYNRVYYAKQHNHT